MNLTLNEYGFTWGPLRVERTMSLKGSVVIRIFAGDNELEVYASPTGRSLRAWKNHKEMKVSE